MTPAGRLARIWTSWLVSTFVFFVPSTTNAQYHRSERQVVAAIRDVVKVPIPTARSYARVIIREATARHFDPFTLVSMARWESHWNPATVNENDPFYSVGLVQIGAIRGNSKCSSRELLPTAACRERIAVLMDGTYNLANAAGLIAKHRQHCRKKTGQPALFARWLSSYQGYDGRPGVTCNMRRNRKGRWYDLPVPRLTQRVIQYRRVLVRKYGSY